MWGSGTHAISGQDLGLFKRLRHHFRATRRRRVERERLLRRRFEEGRRSFVTDRRRVPRVRGVRAYAISGWELSLFSRLRRHVRAFRRRRIEREAVLMFETGRVGQDAPMGSGKPMIAVELADDFHHTRSTALRFAPDIAL
jgi:hypothetical protein